MDTTNIYELKKKYDLEKYVKVDDDWYPNCPGNTVRVRLQILYFKSNYVLFNAWGDDDTGVDMYFDGTFDECVKVYNEYKKLYDNMPEVVNRKWFLDHGFNYA